MTTVLIQEENEFDAFTRGPSLRGISSRGLGWKGFVVEEHHSAEPVERPETVLKNHFLGIWYKHGIQGEYEQRRGRYVPYTTQPRTFVFAPAGIVPAARSKSSCEVLACVLDVEFVKGVEDEMDYRPVERMRFQFGKYDATLFQLMMLLSREAAQQGLFGQLYSEHLAHALATRLLLLGKNEQRMGRREPSALPRHLLDRVLGRMYDLRANLDLKTLAEDTGYSRGHFHRMFYAATGKTPHRYVLQLRLGRAQELLRQRQTALIDIAAECGFSSHAHMSRIFRQLLGISPREYRNSL